MNKLIPISVITGFLGAGKTTLLNHILTNPNGKKYAVIVNEFGEIGIDSDLVIGVDEEIFELNNGCVCCNVRGDLIRILGALFRRKNSFDAILIETTGLANPAPIAQTFFADDDIARRAYLDAIITLVDAAHLIQSLNEFEEAINQIAMADFVILNKANMVTADELAKIYAAIIGINSGVKIIQTNNSIVDIGQILDQNAFNVEKEAALAQYFANQHNDHLNDHHHHNHHETPHYGGVKAIALSSEKPMNEEKFTKWLSSVVDEFGTELLRFKGIIKMQNEQKRYVVNGVHMMVEADYKSEWGIVQNPISRMVFIGKGLKGEILTAGFNSCKS